MLCFKFIFILLKSTLDADRSELWRFDLGKLWLPTEVTAYL